MLFRNKTNIHYAYSYPPNNCLLQFYLSPMTVFRPLSQRCILCKVFEQLELIVNWRTIKCKQKESLLVSNKCYDEYHNYKDLF